jgi:hypothetical protein
MEKQHHAMAKGPPGRKRLDLRFRLLGVLPLLFFVGQAIHYWRINELGQMLWICNMGNLILAVGLFFDQVVIIRVAVIWMIPGLVIWFVYVVLQWGVFLSSTFAHVGGLLLGLVALRKVGVDRAAWLYALGWYLVIQLASRLMTAAELNVNLSHSIYTGWEQSFSAYWKFWMVLTILAAVILWLIGSVLRRFYPPAL